MRGAETGRRGGRLGRLALACESLALLAAAPAAGDGLADAAAAWLATLDDGQRQEALYEFADEERFDLRLAPFGLEGLRGDEMADAQWRGLLEVLGSVLSPEGLAKVETIMSLEREVRALDRDSFFRWPIHFLRDERRYYLALFGEPSADAPFGLRFDGHHVSLNWTHVPGAAPSVTPLFLGSQPREVPAGMERAGLRALAAEEDLAWALVGSLDPEQRARAELPLEITTGPFGGDRALFVGAGARVSPGAPAGVPRRDLAPDQQARLDALIDVYVANFRDGPAAERRRRVDADPDAVHFAYAGEARAGAPGYYRIQGPEFLIEFDDTVADADHVHAVWRERDGDFGRDLLAEHHARAHAGDR